VSGELIVIILVVIVVAALVAHEVRSRKTSPKAESEGGRSLLTYVQWGLMAVIVFFLLGAMGDGCEDEPQPGEPEPVERVTCTSYRAEDCPPVTPVPTPPPTVPPATPHTGGIPEEVPA
jgi:hypothetical protein